jgi:hypothetical protein
MAKATKGKAVRLTVIVGADLAERARNAVDALQGPPMRLRLARLLHLAVQARVTELERAHNGGSPFPRRMGALPR